MKQYLISKKNYNGKIIYPNLDTKNCYRINPRNTIPYAGIKVSKMFVVKTDIIQNIIKRKIKNRLDYYLKVLVSETDESDETGVRIALDDLQRYRYFVKEKYSDFLDTKYMALLNNKLDILERNLKNKVVVSNLSLEEEEYKRSR